MAPITITDVQVIATMPWHSRLIVVKVITSEPGLYGLGCATFTQRWRAVVAAIEGHLKPFLIGRDVTRIEDIFQLGMVHGYWRNGRVFGLRRRKLYYRPSHLCGWWANRTVESANGTDLVRFSYSKLLPPR